VCCELYAARPRRPPRPSRQRVPRLTPDQSDGECVLGAALESAITDRAQKTSHMSCVLPRQRRAAPACCSNGMLHSKGPQNFTFAYIFFHVCVCERVIIRLK